MTTFCRRDERLDGDPARPRLVDSAEVALATIALAAHQPPRDEVIALVLGPDYVGHTIVVVDGTTSPDAVVEVLELIGESAAEDGREHALVLASVRPHVGPLPGDVDRWLELSEAAESRGCELLEWFVITGGLVWCPRDLLAEPPRWPEPMSW
jgi:hypothetical protein